MTVTMQDKTLYDTISNIYFFYFQSDNHRATHQVFEHEKAVDRLPITAPQLLTSGHHSFTFDFIPSREQFAPALSPIGDLNEKSGNKMPSIVHDFEEPEGNRKRRCDWNNVDLTDSTSNGASSPKQAACDGEPQKKKGELDQVKQKPKQKNFICSAMH